MNVFTIVCTIWLLSEILINRLTMSGSSDKQRVDKNSLRVIWLVIASSITLATYLSFNFYLPISGSARLGHIGLALITLGVIMRVIIVRSLGRYFTADVTIRSEHHLKTDGFYKHLRHPSYSASLLSFIGYGIVLNNWASLAIVIVCMVGAFLYRISVEEAVLVTAFGDQYREYMKRTKRLVPFIY